MMVELEAAIPKPTKSIYSSFIKRLLDIILCSSALLVLSPLLLVVSILELIYHGKPILYKTKRPGKDGKVFNLYKFRSMTNERDVDGFLLPEEKRITKFGRFLRRTSIDELPELLNIVKGDMSIIGPRPLLTEYMSMYSARHAYRQCVRPGLACVRIKREGLTDTWTWRDQFENDIYYIEHISLLTDVKMIFTVIKEVIKGAPYRANDTRVPFLGDNLDEIKSKAEVGVETHFDSLN